VKKTNLLALLLIISGIASALPPGPGDPPSPSPVIGKSLFSNSVKRDFSRKGSFYLHWGYNFSWYGKSNIHFTGPGYDFTLKQVVAKDRPSRLSLQYLNPAKLTIPQFNFHIGYYFKDNWAVALGWDHMKYVMDIPQKIIIDGRIDPSISEPGQPTGSFAGTYKGQEMVVSKEMLTFEHTDGLNYASVEVERNDDIWVSHSQKRILAMETGLGTGALIPRSDVRLFTLGKNNYWNLAGYGLSAKAGLKFHFMKRLYLQNSTKVGWINLMNIRTTGRDGIDKANQKIRYIENYTVLGFLF
jgi:hypothetical protein